MNTPCFRSILGISRATALAIIFGAATVGHGQVVFSGADGYGYIGIGGPGTLSITNGASLVSNVDYYVGYLSSGNGTVTVDGAGSTWTNSRSLEIGVSGGTGSLAITNGGSVSIVGLGIGDEGYSAVTVDGLGSTLINLGVVGVGKFGATGSLAISNGGSFSSLGGNIGYNGNGMVTVDGTGSTWTDSGNLIVGYNTNPYGPSTLAITNGGSVSSLGGFVGYSINGNLVSTGTVTVDGTGSTWTNSGSLYVGYGNGGNGSLVVTNGGFVSSLGAFVGYGPGIFGKVTVDGAITNYGGIGSLAGNSWTNTGTLIVGAGGTVSASVVNLLGGTIQVDGTLDPTSVNISAGGTLSGKGTVIGDVSNSGMVILGDSPTSPGTLSEIGNYTQNGDGTLLEGIYSATLNGVLDVTGDLKLGGTLDFDLIGGFTPTAGEIFDVINVTDGTISGAFSSISGADPGDWIVLYNPAGNQQVDLECVRVPVPDISTSALLLIIGLGGIAIEGRRRQKGSSDSRA